MIGAPSHGLKDPGGPGQDALPDVRICRDPSAPARERPSAEAHWFARWAAFPVAPKTRATYFPIWTPPGLVAAAPDPSRNDGRRSGESGSTSDVTNSRDCQRMRLGLMTFPASGEEASADLALASEAGFDLLATGDHLRHPREPPLPVLDGWSVLAAWAAGAGAVRLAMLVSNIIYRHPAVLAKHAITVDQISGGRLDLGVGAGVYPTDHAMAGVPQWSADERVDRLEEFVQALDAALQGQPSFEGRYYRFDGAAIVPGSIQRPRPPILIGAAGPRVLRLAARHADAWSAFGGIDVADEDAFLAAIGQQTIAIDRYCDEIGRDRRSLRRSLLAFRPLRPWRSPGALARLCEKAHGLGFDEIIVYKPANDDERRAFDAAVADAFPALRSP